MTEDKRDRPATPAPDKVIPLRPRRCPHCGRRTVEQYRPFCSKRCAQLDLGRWLNESYRIPGEEEEDPGDGPHEDEA